MTLIKQHERFWKKFENVPLRAANVTFTKNIYFICRFSKHKALQYQSAKKNESPV